MPDLDIRGIILIGFGFLLVTVIIVGMASLGGSYDYSTIAQLVVVPILWIFGFTLVIFSIWRLIGR